MVSLKLWTLIKNSTQSKFEHQHVLTEPNLTNWNNPSVTVNGILVVTERNSTPEMSDAELGLLKHTIFRKDSYTLKSEQYSVMGFHFSGN